HRLREASVRGRLLFVVNREGKVVAYPDSKEFVPGADLRSNSYVVAQVSALPAGLRATETVRHSVTKDSGPDDELIGTYSTIPDLDWAVIAQRPLNEARADAGVSELNRQALTFVVLVGLAALMIGYLFALRISTPIQSLAASTRA